MTQVYFFSGRGHSFALADFFAKQLQTSVTEITKNLRCSVETAIIVFPVYCQNIPDTVVEFLKKLNAKHAVLIATYGRISYGNVLWEASKLTKADVIAAAYVPTGHSFLNEGTEFDSAALTPIFDKLMNPSSAKIKITHKNPFANFFPAWRSRIGLKITRTDFCDACNICGQSCSVGAVENGKINKNCIRCLHCVTVCPKSALHIRQTGILRLYLNQKKKNNTVLYL